METAAIPPPGVSYSLKDVSCAGTGDSRSGQPTILWGTISTEVAGVEGKARSFDGSVNYIEAGNAASLQISTGTVSAWIKTPNAGAGYRGIIVKQYAYGLFMKDNVVGIYDWSTSSFLSTGVNLADGQWHHVAFSFQSGANSGTIVYIDGVAKLITKITVSSQSTELVVGAGGPGIQLFTGSIDEARVFNVIRTASDIVSLWDFKYKLLTTASVAYDDMTAFSANFAGDWYGYQFASVTSYDGVSTPRS
jgi:hypothetical protein